MPKPRKTKSKFKRDNGGGVSSPVNTDLLTPLFSFEKMIDKSGYSVNCCDAEDQAALSRKLFTLSKLDWRSIRSADRHGLGHEIIARDSLKVGLPNSVTDDVNILAFRFNGKKPMLGYRDQRTFYVLLLDHDYSVYDHG